ncbi:MAB_1171c family putative transporter [Streptomyces sp. CA-181903]|uniref:MAB_1171c family putative transporter n=1 Tax=Streptomyces sp. CA-181903 TaxID=3240055 RepID=UPI003D902289
MPTDDMIDLLTTIPLWAVVAFRLYARPTTPGQWAIFRTFAALTVAATLRLTDIEHGIADLTGIRDLAILPKHLLVMLACFSLLGWVETVVPPREPEPSWRRWTSLKYRVALYGVTGIAAAVTFPYAAPSVEAPDGSTDFATPQLGNLAGTLHLVTYLLPMGIALSLSALLCITAARRSDVRLLRLCMGLMAAGAGAGALYPVYRFTFLACGLTHWSYPLSEAGFQRGGALIQAVTILLVIAGSSVRAADVIVRSIRYRRGLIALRPLWQELASVLPPDVILNHFKNGTSLKDDRRRLRDLYGRLDERVVEISDATFELVPWICSDLRRQALAAARSAGLHGTDARAARVAICLRVGRMKALDGEDQVLRPAVSLLSLHNDLLDNAAWLARVAHHYTSPRLAEAATELAGQKTLQKAAA